MKIILEFQLPEEAEEYKLSKQGVDYHIILTDLDNHCRSKLKYTELTDREQVIYEEIRKFIVEACSDRNVTLW